MSFSLLSEDMKPHSEEPINNETSSSLLNEWYKLSVLTSNSSSIPEQDCDSFGDTSISTDALDTSEDIRDDLSALSAEEWGELEDELDNEWLELLPEILPQELTSHIKVHGSLTNNNSSARPNFAR